MYHQIPLPPTRQTFRQLSVSELHRNITLFQVTPNPPDSPPKLSEAERQWRLSNEKAVPENVKIRCNTVPMKNPNEEKQRKISEILDNAEFFMTTSDYADIWYRRRVCTRRIKKMIGIFINYMEEGYKKSDCKLIPSFPNVFHKTVVDVAMVCLCRFRLITDNAKIYTIIQKCVNVIDGLTHLQFDHFAIQMEDDHPDWKTPYTDAQDPLRKLSQDKFTDSSFD